MTPIDHSQTKTHEQAEAARSSDAQDHVRDAEEKLDEELEDSMDASDPPSSTHPSDKGEPVPSSGFTPQD